MPVEPDLRGAYATAEAERLKLASELVTLRRELRAERALRAHPILSTGSLIDLVSGDTDDAYATRAKLLADTLAAHRGDKTLPSAASLALSRDAVPATPV